MINEFPHTSYLFVYGTLMSGFDNPYSEELREHAAYVGTGYLTGKLYKVSWYPGAVYQPDAASRVQGEVYELSRAELLLSILDEYEDTSSNPDESLYLRSTVPVFMSDGQVLSCWTYLYNQSVRKLPRIESGRFTGLN